MSDRVTVLHAGAVTDLVRRGLAPALLDTEDIEVTAVPGHSVALAAGILDGSPILLGESPGLLPRELIRRVQGTYRGW